MGHHAAVAAAVAAFASINFTGGESFSRQKTDL